MDGPMGGGGYTPEQLQAIMEYGAGQGAWEEQDRAIQQQLAQANALKNRGVTPHTTGAGAMFGGIGDVLNGVMGARDAKAAKVQDAALQQARIDALRKLAAGFGPQQQPAQQSQQPGAGFFDPGVAAIYARRGQPRQYYADPGSGGD